MTVSTHEPYAIVMRERDLYLKAFTLLTRKLELRGFCCGYCKKAA